MSEKEMTKQWTPKVGDRVTSPLREGVVMKIVKVVAVPQRRNSLLYITDWDGKGRYEMDAYYIDDLALFQTAEEALADLLKARRLRENHSLATAGD